MAAPIAEEKGVLQLFNLQLNLIAITEAMAVQIKQVEPLQQEMKIAGWNKSHHSNK